MSSSSPVSQSSSVLPKALPEVLLGSEPLGLKSFVELAQGQANAKVAPGALQAMQASYDWVAARLAEGEKIYGVTTGYGASVKNSVSPRDSAELSLNLLRFHGCGTGRLLDTTESAAVLVARLCSVSRGKSGVSPAVAERLATLLNLRILPAIPAEGSVGASGDLTPLSYVAALLVGEREVLCEGGGVQSAAAALAEHNLEPLTLGPKEALALMNGTSVATALGILAFARARSLSRLSCRITALVSRAVGGNPEHFDEVLHQAKGHPGQLKVAEWIRAELSALPGQQIPCRLQDRYSIRCAPHIVGVLVDALDWFETLLVTEVNAVSDNPIVDVAHEAILHGGNFYGSHIGFAMDGLKVAVANIADMLDRQLVLLCQPTETNGLPENLVGVTGEQASIHHGFKAMSISASALTAEALKLTMPASAFSRSTESHNQDKVPMATIGSRDALRVVELTEQVAAICVLAACQAAECRTQAAGIEASAAGPLHAQVRQAIAALRQDRRMDGDIVSLLELMRTGQLESEALVVAGSL